MTTNQSKLGPVPLRGPTRPLKGDFEVPASGFIRFPEAPTDQVPGGQTWRIWFQNLSDGASFGLELTGDCILGRHQEREDVFDLSPYGAVEAGISRLHAMLHPAEDRIYLVDLGSTNGTRRNGQPIGINTPHPLVDGDMITLGKLKLAFRIVEKSDSYVRTLVQGARHGGEYANIIHLLTSQLDFGEVLRQSLEIAMLTLDADETSIWLVDEHSGDLVREAHKTRGNRSIELVRMPVNNSLVGKVLQMGTPYYGGDTEPIKFKPDVLVDDVVMVPLIVGGVTFGVLAAINHTNSNKFEYTDVELLSNVAQTVAIAVQNARYYDALSRAYENQVEELNSLYTLSLETLNTLDLERLTRIVMRNLGERWPAGAVGLWVLDDRSGELFSPLPLVELSSTPLPVRIVPGEGVIGRAARAQQTLFLRDLPSDDLAASERRITNIVGVPLVTDDKLIGYLALVNLERFSSTNDELTGLRLFSLPVASALASARLYAETLHERETMRALMVVLEEPMFILDDDGHLMVSNESANRLLESHIGPLMDGLNRLSDGGTTEVLLGDQTYLTTLNHVQEVGTIVFMQNITYVKNLEKGRAHVLRGLSHDLKSPITSIRGAAELFHNMYDLDQEGEELRQQIIASTDQMLTMIQAMINTSRRIEAPELDREMNDVKALVDRAAEVLKTAARAGDVSIAVQVHGTPFLVSCDEDAIYRVFLNLLDNAVTYSPKGTRVLIEMTYEADELVVQVIDSGPGIPEKDLPHLFSPFYRGSYARSGTHSGIGLEYVYNTVVGHDGSVTASNARRGGACFTVRLPRPKA